jgi:hypothetical protein
MNLAPSNKYTLGTKGWIVSTQKGTKQMTSVTFDTEDKIKEVKRLVDNSNGTLKFVPMNKSSVD